MAETTKQMASEHLVRDLDRARTLYWEDPAGSLAAAVSCQEAARTLGDEPLRSRALSLQGAITLHRGDLHGAFELAVAAEPPAGADIVARVEVACLKAHLSFFSGSYAEALGHAELALELADGSGDVALRIFTRRAACMVFGNLGVEGWPDQLAAMLRLTVAAGDRWQEAISHNDLACMLQEQGDADGAEVHLQQGLDIAVELGPHNGFALGVLHSTRADIRLLAGRPEEALADAELAIAHLIAGGEPNPYVFGITVRAQVQALMTLGRLDEAQASGEGALSRLGDRVPQARSLILATIAAAFRDAGRVEEAYDALARSAELERQAFRELSQLQLSLERATLETRAARREADAFAAKNQELESVVRQLAEAHAQLGHRTGQLESLQDQLRDQADRDWLTGLHNRRFLARELERLTTERLSGPFSVAVLDLDHFKSINDRFGHEAGDRVLVRVAALLLGVLRQSDVVVRTGGEEFVVLMPATDAHAAVAVCERLRVAISGEDWDAIVDGMKVTASLGVASAVEAIEPDALTALADHRLYAAKRGGRDCVVAG
jgi:diguanylate cyclase (GGDEF)-like protein